MVTSNSAMSGKNVLQTPIEYLKGVGPGRATLLRQELSINTFQDLLHLFPNRYIDRTQYHKIGHLVNTGAEVQIIGTITHVQLIDQKRGKRLVAEFKDETGTMELIWFRGHKWIKQSLKTGVPLVAFGRLTQFQGQFSMAHPELEEQQDHEQQLRTALQPLYPSTEKLSKSGVSNRLMNQLMTQVIKDHLNTDVDPLPEFMLTRLKLMNQRQALTQIHFPKDHNALARAQFRLKFEELFFIQLQLLRKNLIHKKKIKGYQFSQVGELFNTFFDQHLPFQLTQAQKRVIKEIRQDLGGQAQMNRLLQGDVGSGKTIVAFMSMLLALDNGFQACILAPTEILSVQHYNVLKEYCNKLNISISLLTSSTKTLYRKTLLEDLKSGTLRILVGTHALLENRVVFNNLGLAIIDEQHRFGVAQRSKLWHKNEFPPNVLVMTATPIPRTLAMSLYGDLDISVIDALPPGRKPVKTVHRFDNNRLKVFGFIRQEIALGCQVYIVYPLIQESQAMDYKDLMDGYESVVREFPSPKYQVSIVHGQMKSSDKDFEMQRFASGQTQIMVATTVIEVGVNVPNASVMIIESAERFGLSQLHQLRGRVGRGADQSYCILMSGNKLSDNARERLQTMVATNDGFEISEADLRLRGPGDLMGTQQSGVLQLKIADLVKDGETLKIARSYAQELLKQDPDLNKPEHLGVRNTLSAIFKYKNIWHYIS